MAAGTPAGQEAKDLPAMKELGVASIFQPGASLESIIHFMRENRPKRDLLQG